MNSFRDAAWSRYGHLADAHFYASTAAWVLTLLHLLPPERQGASSTRPLHRSASVQPGARRPSSEGRGLRIAAWQSVPILVATSSRLDVAPPGSTP